MFQLLAEENTKHYMIRNGVQLSTQEYAAPSDPPSVANDMRRRSNRVQVARGLHESFDWYDACYNRPRNDGWYPLSIELV